MGPTGTPFAAPIDLRTGFADLGDAKSTVTARLGRQELVFGEQRLIDGRQAGVHGFDFRRVNVHADDIEAALNRAEFMLTNAKAV